MRFMCMVKMDETPARGAAGGCTRRWPRTTQEGRANGVLIAQRGAAAERGRRDRLGSSTGRSRPSTGRSPRRRSSSAATRWSTCARRRRPSNSGAGSCSSTSTTRPTGRARSRSARSPSSERSGGPAALLGAWPLALRTAARVVSCSRGEDDGRGRRPEAAPGQASTTRAAIEAVWRLESTRLIAALVRIVRDVGARRGPRAGRDRRGARAVARVGHPRQPRRLADDHREAPRDRHLPRSAPGTTAASRRSPHDLAEAVDDDPGAGIDHVEDDVLRLMFICCHPALTAEAQTHAHPQARRRTLDARDRPGLPGARGDDRAARSRGPSAPSPRPAPRSRSRAAPSAPSAWRRCSASSTCSSTRATRQPRATTGCGRRSATRRCGSAASSRRSCPTTPRCTGSRRSWSCSRRGSPPVPAPTASRSCSTHQDRERWDAARIRRGLDALARADALVADVGAEAGPDRMRCRRRSPRSTRARHPSTTPTGTASPTCTSSSAAAPGRPSSSSIARSRSGVHDGPAGGARPPRPARRTWPPLRGYHLVPSVRGDLYEQLGAAPRRPSSSSVPRP